MNGLTKDQGTSILQRIVYAAVMFLAMKAVARGYIDADMAAYIAVGIAGAADTAYAWWTNRPKAIVQAAANIPGTTVITTAALSAATPEQNNIVSSVAEAKDAIAANKS